MTALITDYGLALVFANVLLERAGLPLPVLPLLLVCGGLVGDGELAVGPLFGIVLGACTIGDTLWYFAGWVYGRRIMRLLCLVSLSPDSCVRRTEGHFERWGKLTLVLAKFVPGLSMVARPLAGAMRLSLGSFELLNGLGSAVWIGAAIGAGVLFHDQIRSLLGRLRDLGSLAGALIGVLLAVYIAFKWWERRRFSNMLRMARITVDELRRRLDGDDIPVIVDVRAALGRSQDRHCIPGALEISVDEVPRRLRDFPPEREVVLYCACPNEASAAYAARKLLDRGYVRVRPLLGGLDAWVAAGHEVEHRPGVVPLPAASTTAAP